MKKYILGVAFLLATLSPAFVQAQTTTTTTAGLSATQISAILSLLQAFGADQSVICNVQATLGGGNSAFNNLYGCSTTTTQPLITITSPSAGDNWQIGNTYNIQWNVSGQLATRTVHLVGTINGVRVDKYLGSTDGNQLNYTVDSQISPVGSYMLRVCGAYCSGISSNFVQVNIVSGTTQPTYPPGCSSFSGFSTMTGNACNGTWTTPTVQTITVLSPTTGMTVTQGLPMTISWESVVNANANYIVGESVNGKGSIGTFSATQAHCDAASKCYISWTPNFSAPSVQIGIIGTYNNISVGSGESGSFSIGSSMITVPGFAPTVTFLGTPTLSLQFDSAGKEANLVSSATVRVTTGNSSIDSYAIAAIVQLSKNGGFVPSNSMQFSPGVQYGVNKISANSSATYTITETVPAKELFAGTYSLSLAPFTYTDAGAADNAHQIQPSSFVGVTVNSTGAGVINGVNPVTIVGEVSPYISSVGSDLAGNATIKGVRLGDSSGNVQINYNGKTKTYQAWTPNSYGPDVYVNFKPSDFGVTYSLTAQVQIINSSVGNSNIVWLNYTAPTTTTTPTITVASPIRGSGYYSGNQMVVAWSESGFTPKNMVIYLNGSALAGQSVPVLASLGASSQLIFTAAIPDVPSGTDYTVSVCDNGTPSPIASFKPLCGTSAQFNITGTTPAPNPAPNVMIYANPTTITAGQSSQITVSSNAPLNGCQFSNNSGELSGLVNVVSSTVSPTQTTLYMVTCTNAGGSTTRGATVTVTPATATAPTVTSSFSPSAISSTGSTVYSYSSNNTTHCVSSHPGGTGGWDNIITNASFPPTTYTAAQYPNGLTTTITCYNSAGQSAVSTQTLTVTNLGASALDAYSSASNSAKNSETSSPQGTGNTSSFHYVWNNNLQIGSSYTEDVKALQTALTREGMYTGEISGGFYNQTFSAVKAFQQKYGIDTGTTGAGFVGSKTRAKLNTLY